jgi:twitching motility protein PilI
MANKQALRDLQTRLAERMKQVRTEQPGVAWLAVDCAGCGLLFALHQAGEIFKLGVVLPVPHTRPWLAGVVNLRGGLYTVVDPAVFLGLREQPSLPAPAPARLVALNGVFGVNVALMVDRLEGLRHASDLRVMPESDDNAARPAFALARWQDAAGRVWQEIDLAELARLPQFLAITG